MTTLPIDLAWELNLLAACAALMLIAAVVLGIV